MQFTADDFIEAKRAHGTYRAAALAMGLPNSTFQRRYERARDGASAGPRVPKGELRAAGRVKRDLPPPGAMKTYIVTSAQNNTGLHNECWRNLLAIADHTDAEIIVGAFTYRVTDRAADGQKKTGKEAAVCHDEWWDARLEPYMVNDRVEIAPGLVWCGELQILPTAVNPISGLESYTGPDSTIIPHVKQAMQSIAAPKHRGAKFIYTTGCVTLRNYIQKKAGQKAEFHHGYGAMIVEVCSDGSWFARHLNADSEGVIYDFDKRAAGGKVTVGHSVEALVWGDIHVRQLETDVKAIQWGRDGILDALRPARQILHDVLDFRSQNHHDRKDPWKSYEKHVTKGDGVSAEVYEAAAFVAYAARDWCETVIVRSNHDEAMVRWLKEADFRLDPQNAVFLLSATLAYYNSVQRHDRHFDAIEWAFRQTGIPMAGVRFLRRDEELIVCPEAGGGIELGMHGDVGANGSRGSVQQYARTGRKCIVGHSHSAALRDGAMQVGVSGSLDQGYNEGQSSWSHTHAVVYPNGKRSLFTVSRGRWRGTCDLYVNRSVAA